jgi:hypothetical protein
LTIQAEKQDFLLLEPMVNDNRILSNETVLCTFLSCRVQKRKGFLFNVCI